MPQGNLIPHCFPAVREGCVQNAGCTRVHAKCKLLAGVTTCMQLTVCRQNGPYYTPGLFMELQPHSTFTAATEHSSVAGRLYM